MDHPLHQAVAYAIAARLESKFELIREHPPVVVRSTCHCLLAHERHATLGFVVLTS